MTALVERHPLQTLSMSAAQRGPRRLSARLQEKDVAQPVVNSAPTNGGHSTNTSGAGAGGSGEAGPATKKRKMEYDEDDDGFSFSRVKKRKPRVSTSKTTNLTNATIIEEPAAPLPPAQVPIHESDKNAEQLKKRRHKMSFSTPGRPLQEPLRRSKRLSAEEDEFRASPEPPKRSTVEKNDVRVSRDQLKQKQSSKRPKELDKTPAPIASAVELPVDDHNATKISLPFADTPVIRRNKAMREGKPGKGERRSSLGLRGRRASSLIESGNSNALPHHELAISDFYKHIESEGLPEPRRMRQLLTWCATRALREKSTGGEFEDQSARMAARVIQEELLKDLANRSEMSDWFSRDEAPAPAKPLEIRPNPKNEQNAAKIKELQEQIERLRGDRAALEALSKPPSIPEPADIAPEPSVNEADRSLLSPEDAALLDSLATASRSTETIQVRLTTISASLGPTLDSFADGIHKMAQFRNAADQIASRALAICAEKLEGKEKENRDHSHRQATKRAGDGAASEQLQQVQQNSPGTQLGNVLRSLSRIER